MPLLTSAQFGQVRPGPQPTVPGTGLMSGALAGHAPGASPQMQQLWDQGAAKAHQQWDAQSPQQQAMSLFQGNQQVAAQGGGGHYGVGDMSGLLSQALGGQMAPGQQKAYQAFQAEPGYEREAALGNANRQIAGQHGGLGLHGGSGYWF